MESPALPWLSAPENRPIAERIAAVVAREIAEGDIGPGELLTEVEVAARHGASRTPTREAMLRLSTWGLVRLVPKKGALVTSPTARERQELLSVRSMLEGHAVARLVGDDARRTVLLEALTPILAAQAASLERPTEFALHDFSFHLRLIEHDDNRVVEEILRTLAPRLYRLTHLAITAPSADLEAMRREHVDLAEAVARQDIPAFRDLIESHLSAGHGRYEVSE